MTTPPGVTFNERTLIPAVVITVAAFLAGIFFFLNSGDKKISVKVFIIYTLVTVLLFALMGLTALIAIENPLSYFIWTQVGMLVLGIAHAATLSYLNNRENEGVFWNEVIFTLYVMLLGGFIFLFLRSRVGEPGGYNLFLLTSLLAFIVPFFFLKTFNFLIAIPGEEYEKWSDRLRRVRVEECEPQNPERKPEPHPLAASTSIKRSVFSCCRLIPFVENLKRRSDRVLRTLHFPKVL